MRWLKQTYDWVEKRVQLEGPVKDAAMHPVPRNTASWFYVFGSASFVLLILQIVTGMLLAVVYVPSAGNAWNSLDVLNHHITLGWFLRAMHGWGSNFMVAVVLVHMVQVFLFGAYKFPRELTWILGARYCASIRMLIGVWGSEHRSHPEFPSLADPLCTLCLAGRSSQAQRSRDSLHFMCS
jgi:quinol-cytochrome oxidoreductase complex cytochrome b subunit